MRDRGYHGRHELKWRPTVAQDAERILPLMQRCFRNPWTIQELRRHLRDDEVGPALHSASRGLIAVEDDADYCGPAGYALFTWHRRLGAWEILHLAVHPNARRRGVASQLLLELIGPLRYHGCREHLTVSVGETNLAAQLLFRSAGFYLHAVLRDWLESDDEAVAEDGYQFVYDRIALRLNNAWPPGLRGEAPKKETRRR